MNSRSVASLVGFVLVIAGSSAMAQPGQPPPPPPPPPSPYYAPPPTYVAPPPAGRSGFMIGFSVGGGEIVATDCSGCGSLSGGALDFSIGAMISPVLGIMYDAFLVIRPEDNLVFINGTNTVAAQYWVTPQLWIKGGVGFSQIRISDSFGGTAAEYGFGVTAGVGFELLHAPNFAIDLRLRASHGTFDGGGLSNGALLVGFHWF